MPKPKTFNKKVNLIVKRAKHLSNQAWNKLAKFINKRPLIAFFTLMGILVALIVVGDLLRRPSVAETVQVAQAKPVEIYHFSDTPKITLTAKVEKAGVLNIVAQTPGVVQKINFYEGDRVTRSNALINLSSNYQGGNAAVLSRQLAQKNYDFTSENYDLQKDMIAKQRELAEKGNTMAHDLRDINSQSIDETKDAISLSEDILDSLNDQIDYLISTNVGGANDAAILGAKQGKAAALSGLNQLKAALRNSEYQVDDDNPPAQMDDISKELTFQQLELQEKSLALSKDIALLNLKLARVSEAMMFPTSPFSGVVERVHVKVGQAINPGQVLFTIRADEGENTAVISTSAEIARSVLNTENSILHIAGHSVELLPDFISSEATNGNLYTIMYSIPSEYDGWTTNNGSISIDVPIGPQKIIVNDPLVPLDAIYQTQEKAFVYVAIKDGDNFKAAIREVKLAEVSGQYVAVIDGLSLDDLIILSRNVQEGELISVE